MFGQSLNGSGTVYNYLTQYTLALEFYQQALDIAKQTGDKKGESANIIGIGSVYYKQRQYAKTLKLYQQALAIYQQIGSKAESGSTLNSIAAVYSIQVKRGQGSFYQGSGKLTRYIVGLKQGHASALGAMRSRHKSFFSLPLKGWTLNPFIAGQILFSYLTIDPHVR